MSPARNTSKGKGVNNKNGEGPLPVQESNIADKSSAPGVGYGSQLEMNQTSPKESQQSENYAQETHEHDDKEWIEIPNNKQCSEDYEQKTPEHDDAGLKEKTNNDQYSESKGIRKPRTHYQYRK